MNTTTSYPIFEPDQVLTDVHLNGVFNYLDRQHRLSRMKLIGCGIVCGLEIAVNPNTSISVSKGCGLTSQGYLITFCDTVFTHFIEYAPKNFPNDLLLIKQCEEGAPVTNEFYKPAYERGTFKLLSSEQFDALNRTDKDRAVAMSAGVDLANFAVVLFMEADEVALKNCDTNDCNDKGSRMDFEVRGLLVQKNMLDRLRQAGEVTAPIGSPTVSPQLKHVELRRYNVPVRDIKTADDVLLAFANLVDDAKLKSIAEVLNYCFMHYYFLLKDEPSNPFQNVWEQFKTMRDDILSNEPILIQYYYDFIDDILKAYHEFTCKAFEVNSTCCGNEMKFPLYLMLGEATLSTPSTGHADYREYFIYSPLFNNQTEKLAEVRLLFAKLKLLISEVDFASITKYHSQAIKITPSRYGKASLSARCIPYNYKVATNGSELYRRWSYEKLSRGYERFNLGYNASEYSTEDTVLHPLLYDIERFNFFRIEGHIGKNISQALSLVKSAQQQNNLPFDVTALSADFIGALLKGQEPQCVIQDLESDYRRLIAEFICKMHNSFCSVARQPYKLPERIFRFNAEAFANATDKDASIIRKTLVFDRDILDKADHPFTSSLVNEFQAIKGYVRGKTLSSLCNPVVDTFGGIYVKMKGIFTNPITVSPSLPVTTVQFHAFEFIDALEAVLELVMNFELAELDIAELKKRYSRLEKEIRTLSHLAITVIKKLESHKLGLIATLARELDLDTLVMNLEMFKQICFVEQIEAIKKEYARRMAQYRLAKNFGQYFKTHGGVTHGAGAPIGGTFILVYHEIPKRRVLDKNAFFINKELSTLMLGHFREMIEPDVAPDKLIKSTELLQSSIWHNDPDLYARFRKVLTGYLDNCDDLPEDKREELTDIINQPPRRPQFELEDGMVIADFYVPYLCCSDCPPVAYILPEKPAKLGITQQAPVCDLEGRNYVVKLTVTGGTPPYSYAINGMSIPNSDVTLPSGSPDTVVTVKDVAGDNAVVTVKGHTCTPPCNLPCGGEAEKCMYALWVAKPQAPQKIQQKMKFAKLSLTDEFGVVTTLDVMAIFDASVTPIVTNGTYDSMFAKLVKGLNTMVPPNFIDGTNKMFNYDKSRQLLVIDRFACQSFTLEFQIDVDDIRHLVTYNNKEMTVSSTSSENIAVLPKFGCIKANKCTGESKELCQETLVISSIFCGEMAAPGGGSTGKYGFSIPEQFDKYLWYFHNGTPTYSNLQKPEGIRLNNLEKNWVRVIGVNTQKGCFAILEQNVRVEPILL